MKTLVVSDIFCPSTAGIPSSDLVRSANIVFVSFNYRLNVFGFLALDVLSSTDPQSSSGNYGLMDQLTALRWVQLHIGSFGGDPNKASSLCFISFVTKVTDYWTFHQAAEDKVVYSELLCINAAIIIFRYKTCMYKILLLNWTKLKYLIKVFKYRFDA